MNKNIIIDKIFKKLIKKDFTKDEIWQLINLQNQFSNFNNYLYYLMIIGQKKHQDTIFNMAQSINSYVVTIIERYNINNELTLNKIQVGQIFTDIELFLLGVKGYGNNNNYQFDNENNLYICIDNVHFFNHKNIYHFKFNEYHDGFLNSKINMKIINNEINKILLFKQESNFNKFLGFYKLKNFDHFYLNSQQLYGFTVIPEDDEEINSITEFEHLIKRESETSLLKLKTELTEIINTSKNESFNFLNIISMCHNHITLLFHSIQHGLITNNKNIINEIKRRYGEMISLGFNIFSLVPMASTISEYHLILLANCLDILYGKQINYDYLNNTYLCFNKSSMSFEDDERITIRFVKSFYNRYFDIDENKIMFNTTKEPTCIYVFNKNDANNYLFLGFYKVEKVFIDYDLQKKQTPVFKLRKFNDNELINHIQYLIKNESTNNYKNCFKNLSGNELFPMEWINNTNYDELKTNDCTNDRLNSLNTKYNWIIKKTLLNYNNDKYNKYFKNYIEFDNRIINWVFKSLSYDFKYLIDNRLMQPWTIAYEMTKRNWGSKILFDISYIDHYATKNVKYENCLNIIDCKK